MQNINDFDNVRVRKKMLLNICESSKSSKNAVQKQEGMYGQHLWQIKQWIEFTSGLTNLLEENILLVKPCN